MTFSGHSACNIRLDPSALGTPEMYFLHEVHICITDMLLSLLSVRTTWTARSTQMPAYSAHVRHIHYILCCCQQLMYSAKFSKIVYF